jgi:hypothetical protein
VLVKNSWNSSPGEFDDQGSCLEITTDIKARRPLPGRWQSGQEYFVFIERYGGSYAYVTRYIPRSTLLYHGTVKSTGDAKPRLTFLSRIHNIHRIEVHSNSLSNILHVNIS